MTVPSTTLRCQYRYDPLDRLVHQTQPDTPVHQRFYCKSRLATEIQGATKHSIIQYDDLLLAQQQRGGDELDTTLLATDLQRSVLHTLKKGTQPHPIAYPPYGHRSVLGGLLSLLGFNGERPDPVTGCYLLGNGYRAFNPVLMRFNSPDSWSPFGEGGINSYMYCKGDPANHSDATGHMPTGSLATALKILTSINTPTTIKTINAKIFSSVITETSTYLTTYKYTNSLGHSDILAYAHTAPMNTPPTHSPIVLRNLAFKSTPKALLEKLPPYTLNKVTPKLDIDKMINENTKKLINSNPQTQTAMKIDTYNMALRGKIPHVSAQNAITSLNAMDHTPQNTPILKAFGYIDAIQTRQNIRHGY
ncbi:RHS repeat-associated core domain-containing protein [Pseudomonas mohnii]|jgi:RHS repeat-associated protein